MLSSYALSRSCAESPGLFIEWQNHHFEKASRLAHSIPLTQIWMEFGKGKQKWAQPLLLVVLLLLQPHFRFFRREGPKEGDYQPDLLQDFLPFLSQPKHFQAILNDHTHQTQYFSSEKTLFSYSFALVVLPFVANCSHFTYLELICGLNCLSQVFSCPPTFFSH